MMNFLRYIAVGIKGGGNVEIPEIGGSTLFNNALNIIYFIAGAVAVGMIIFAGIQYMTANGDTSKTKKAMNTIVYSIVGLVVVLIAFAITNFVINRVG